MTAPQPQGIQVPPGLLALTTYGSVTPETVHALMEMRSFNDKNGINNVAYSIVPGHLVDKTRNEAARAVMQNPNLQYLMFLDADMTFQPNLMALLLQTAYGTHPWADIVGGWCPLRGKPYLPTIDTGTGTWEQTDANQGVMEVIRTGGACVLIKRHVFERMEWPWFGVRPAPRALDMLAEIDNFARCKMDGRNPLMETETWKTLQRIAKEEAGQQRLNPQSQGPGGTFSSVGEDSNFADKAKALGFRIVVNTDAVCHHMDRLEITPQLHMDTFKGMRRDTWLAFGVMD